MQDSPDRKLSAETYNWLGLSLYRAGRASDARVALQRLLMHWADDKSKAALVEQAYYWLAMCYQAEGREEPRVNTLKALAAKFPASQFVPAAKLAIADRHVEQGRHALAEPLYRDVAKLTAGALQAEALCKLGETLLRQGKHRDAVKVLARVAIVFDAPQTRTWALRAGLAAGQCYEALGDARQAEAQYRAPAKAPEEGADVAKLRQQAAAHLRRLLATTGKGGRP